MKRKYRFLKPNEKIQYGDWYNSKRNESSKVANPEEPGWLQSDKDDWKVGRKAGENTSLAYIRYVGPVTKARPYHPKTVPSPEVQTDN